MKHQLKLGKSAGDLINAFLGGDAYERKGYDEYSGKLATAEKSRQAARKTGLEADVLERAAGIGLPEIMEAFGAVPEEEVPGEYIAKPGYREEQELLRGRAENVNLANLMAGKSGTIQQMMQAFGGAQEQGDIDAIRRGLIEPGPAGQAYAATQGKPLFKQGTSGILDLFTGAVEPTEYSRRGGATETALQRNIPFIAETMGIDKKEAAQLLTQSKQDSPMQFYQKVVGRLINETDADDVEIGTISEKIMNMVYGDTWQNPNVPADAGGGNDDPLGLR